MKLSLAFGLVSLASAVCAAESSGVKPFRIFDEDVTNYGGDLNVIAFSTEHRSLAMQAIAESGYRVNEFGGALLRPYGIQIESRLLAVRLATGRDDIEAVPIVSDRNVASSDGASRPLSYRAVETVEPGRAAASLPPELINVSTRAHVGSGQDVAIAGLVIGGTEPRTVLVRGLGPAIGATPFNVSGTIPNPRLEIYSGQTKVAENDDWTGSTEIQTVARQVGAFAIAPGSKDAAILITLDAKAYTIVMSAAQSDARTGIGLIEVYDVSRARGLHPNSRLLNLSTRIKGNGTGANSAFVGFVADGVGQLSIVLRVAGPSLRQFGITNPLENPSLVLRNGQGATIATNDNWGALSSLASTFSVIGAFPFQQGSSDAAVDASLAVNGATSWTMEAPGNGVVLVEAYRRP